jgi:hypothetical protein
MICIGSISRALECTAVTPVAGPMRAMRRLNEDNALAMAGTGAGLAGWWRLVTW